MSKLDDEEENLAEFLEFEFLSEVSDEDEDTKDAEERPTKRACREDDPQKTKNNAGDAKNDVRDINGDGGLNAEGSNSSYDGHKKSGCRIETGIETGILSKIPPELFLHILKFLSSEILLALGFVASYKKVAGSFMEKAVLSVIFLLQRDEEDIIQSVRNCQPEFKEYYFQMYSAKRSQAPLLSQVNDDRIILDKTVADQVSIWKRNRGLSDKVVTDHTCSGEVCSYFQIGNVFICEKTGNVHVCDETCKEIIPDPQNELLEQELQQDVVTDEAEPFMGAGATMYRWSL
ncbi:hypothetical protein Cgig2_021971 [Carnegiea gigantea]|uniref:F-box domain-containing protein n=1 Tax=Carnegiea gigantea TaxID=171969 RepID=A0A9Q1KRQ4_9CARY|nr:hypothetical protein Cgig2_021971 [Carnegiea gigantea]